jgi:hypothetical protein
MSRFWYKPLSNCTESIRPITQKARQANHCEFGAMAQILYGILAKSHESSRKKKVLSQSGAGRFRFLSLRSFQGRMCVCRCVFGTANVGVAQPWGW